jgi:hypothetical protein
MTRSALRRAIERLALASLPLTGGACGGGHPTSLGPPADMAIVANDLQCPSYTNGCFWLQYVDAGKPNGNITYWFADGGSGVDPCIPCGFEQMPGVVCGACEIVANSCGSAYFCSILDCSAACEASGRRPAGLIAADAQIFPSLADGLALGEKLARMAHLEAASVPAFAQLAAELAAHGAPESLIAAARRAGRDEIRHAEAMTSFAREQGARPLALDVAPTPLRPLADVARENAVEGCVRETAGAALAARQAALLGDTALGRALAAIAVDERRHADLAWAVDAWIAPRLSPAERAAVENERAAAVRALAAA